MNVCSVVSQEEKERKKSKLYPKGLGYLFFICADAPDLGLPFPLVSSFQEGLHLILFFRFSGVLMDSLLFVFVS